MLFFGIADQSRFVNQFAGQPEIGDLAISILV
jgi:hypothetical protein